MSSRTFFIPALVLCVASVCALSAACAGSSSSKTKVVAEAPPPPSSSKATAAPPESVESAEAVAPARVLPTPGASEVRAAVERIFKGAVTTAAAGREPEFAVGDFNGDDSQDIAVAVSPAPGRLGEMNDELANWIVKDPFAPASEGSPYGEARRRTLVEEADALLAVIHGYGADGWRDARATQTYVLKDAAGERLRSRARAAALSSGPEDKLPRLLGDVIAERIGGREGFLYYNGAHYLWYDPRGYKPLPPARVVHGGAVREVRQ